MNILRCLPFIAFAGFLIGCETTTENPNRIGVVGYWSNGATVETAYGVVRGKPDKDDTWAWRGIPYARPPVGDLRWRAPLPPQPWDGVRRTARFGSQCAQFSPVIPGLVVGSEDCLYLNVWRPATSETALPVYVWIHGGGNSMSSASMVPDYYGHALASRSNMVFVSFNYRLGPFGWFSHPAIRSTSESQLDASGNYGTLDIVAALRWIRENISAFGGDPEKVIITGESAGGFNVTSLLISPIATGLFSHAMSQSGGPRSSTLDVADQAADRVLQNLLIRDGVAEDTEDAARLVDEMTPSEIRKFLLDKSARQLLSGYSVRSVGMIDSPAIFTDGYVIPKEGYKVIDAGEHPNKVPLILGANKEEVKLFFTFDSGFDWRSDLYQAAGKYGSRFMKANSVDGFARKLADYEDQPPVYAYRFDWGSPDKDGESPMPGNWGKRLGAGHTMEIPFFLGTDTINGLFHTWSLYSKRNFAGRKALSGMMMDYISSFVRTGDPNTLRGPDSEPRPIWEPWSNGDGLPKSIIFDVDGDIPAVRMTTLEETEEGIYAAMKEELGPALYQRTIQYLGREGR